MLDIGLLHHLEELARIGGQALDIAPLPFGIDRIEGKRAFARAREAGDDDQRIPRQVDIDALEVMLARTAHGDFGKCHRARVPVSFGSVKRQAHAPTDAGARGAEKMREMWVMVSVLQCARSLRLEKR